jgi:Holliday junction resolvasome RuvABC endonuclease subunit
VIRVALGIDPGLASCGIALLVREPGGPWRARFVETVRTKAREPLHDRMRQIFWAIRSAPREPLQGVRPAEFVVCCETQTGVQEGKRRSGETSASALLVQQVVGMARVVALSEGAQFVEVTPAQVKSVLPGMRTASKAQVQRAIRAFVRECPKVMSEHASDAIAAAIAGARRAR